MVLEIKNGTLEHDGQVLFERLNLVVRDGEMVCVGGEPGCGKTALLKAVLGFQPLSGGFISVDGTLVTRASAPTFRRMTAYIPQEVRQLTDRVRPAECVLPPAEGYSVCGETVAKRARKPAPDALELSPEETLRLMKETLSAKEGRKLILADEPTTGMPDDIAAALTSLLRRQAQAGSLVLVTGNDGRLTAVADRYVRMTKEI